MYYTTSVLDPYTLYTVMRIRIQVWHKLHLIRIQGVKKYKSNNFKQILKKSFTNVMANHEKLR